MKKIYRFLFILILLISTYHLIRDTFQVFDIHNFFIDIWNRPHFWCRPYCDFATYPLDIFNIVGSVMILKRNKVSLLGILVIASLPLWLLVAFLP